MRNAHPNSRRRFLQAAAASLASLASLTGLWPTLRARSDERTLLRKGTRRVTPLCSLPPADYQHGARSPSVIARSRPALPVHDLEGVEGFITAIKELDRARLAELQPGLSLESNPYDRILQQAALSRTVSRELSPRAKLFQLPQRALVIGHCEVSDLMLLIDHHGGWRLSLRGDQNPLDRDATQPQQLQLHLKRNAFNVRIRLLAAARGSTSIEELNLNDPGGLNASSRLALCQFQTGDFWVQRGAPEFVQLVGFEPAIREAFARIDQAEFEFFIQLDPLTGSGAGVVIPR
jgi:hypothetical protein